MGQSIRNGSFPCHGHMYSTSVRSSHASLGRWGDEVGRPRAPPRTCPKPRSQTALRVCFKVGKEVAPSVSFVTPAFDSGRSYVMF